jgi:beta-xylosidase
VIALTAVLIVTGVAIGRLAPGPTSPAVTAFPKVEHSSRVAPTLSYRNPVIATDFPDPAVAWDGARYVAVSTGSEGRNVPVAVSSNLARWQVIGDALPAVPPWAEPDPTHVWAPDLEQLPGRWILWFSARDRASQDQCIGWASASSAEGPFRGNAGQATICQVALGGSIDPSVFVDTNGDRWLLWKNDGNAVGVTSRIWSVRLAPDGATLAGAPVAILSYRSGWEQAGHPGRSTVENPSMVFDAGRYHLFFSANDYDSAEYGEGHALCQSPQGPCVEPSGSPILASIGLVAGPGGGSVFEDRFGRLWLAYAAWTAPQIGYQSGGVRSMRIDRVVFLGNLAVVLGPTDTIVREPTLAAVGATDRVVGRPSALAGSA